MGKRRKKLPRPKEIVFSCKGKTPSLKKKVKIFCKSELEIGALLVAQLESISLCTSSVARITGYVAYAITCYMPTTRPLKK